MIAEKGDFQAYYYTPGTPPYSAYIREQQETTWREGGF